MTEGALARLLARRIRSQGPLTIAEWMAECLGHPRHGYYVSRDPLGRGGDFTTAPEISQMFGELIGLWCVDTWQAMGSPRPVRLVELGPGRGTLMADALRAARLVPAFGEAVDLHLVETSPALRARQAASLGAAGASWHDHLATIPAGPLLLVANEFFDALPIHQLQRTAAGWVERRVTAGEDGGFALALGSAPSPLAASIPATCRDATPGSVFELCPAAASVAQEIGWRLARDGGAALIIDYGHAVPGIGDTLQAVRRHAFAPVLADPGEADLTAHVDFAALAAAAAPALAHGPVEQGRFLERLGIRQRAASLSARASTTQRQDIASALDRLVGPRQMGTLFKVLALTGTDLPQVAGFDPPPPSPPRQEPSP